MRTLFNLIRSAYCSCPSGNSGDARLAEGCNIGSVVDADEKPAKPNKLKA
jgi:hypothetical protein